MKKHLSGIVIFLIFVLGIGIMLYPVLSDYVNRRHSSKVITEYHNFIEGLDSEKLRKDVEEAEEYNQTLAKTPDAFYKPWLIEGYHQTLNITGTGIMGYISIDKIGVELPIYHGVEQEVLQIGVGHLPGTSFPVGGSSTHAVLSGHRGLPSAKLFTDLDKLEVGDSFTITIHDVELTYVIDQVKIVLPTEAEDLKIEDGKDYCTLLTCTPYGINSHRLLVRGARGEKEPVSAPKIYVANEAFQIEPWIVAIFILIPLVVIAFSFLAFLDYGDRKRRLKRLNKKLASMKKEKQSDDEE